MLIRCFLLSALIVVLSVGVIAQDRWAQDRWPQFRGAQSLGVAEDANLPDKWSATENVAWKTELPGMGWSSPIVWGDRIFLTSVVNTGETEPVKKGLYFGGERPLPASEHRWMVYAVDFKTGKIVWEREVHRAVPKITRHLKNSYASETPVTDGERVYAYFGNIGLFCFDLKGELLWKQMFDAKKTRFGWGTAASPVLYKDRLYIVNDNDEESWLMALDKKTGKEIWKVAREKETNWATPYIWENGTRTELIVPATKGVRAYDLDGKVLWEFKGMSSIAIPTPFSKHGLLFIASGYVGDQHRPVYAVKPGASGDISLKEGETSNQFIAWYQRQAGPYNPSPIVYGDLYYTLLDRGFFTAHDAKTGKEVYGKQRIDPAAGAFTSSPWAYNGKLFCLSEDGDTFVIQAGNEYKLLGKNSLDELCMATPAIAKGSLIIRTASKLYRISNGGKK
ncbi:MAG TPA: PQQ-binding-like beta-propeller repeat protein [Blastocatellia bacterium]|nr:PQQ-binding-like beta-propeller repeat protein [Blastocatellia bacterium]HMV87298.1 PQQ-binding-like beta-propeller repeat protein [Blastocatellia bacterium]HMZ22409.1 PQQ-binding-like beta-propeller repeat protein [Blastocatellia bacterium]HNG32421.1 PQQ-binding-like beta-propeller repeat protein [Blastocatellia bacterium]